MKTNLKGGVLLGIALVVATQILTWLGLGTSNWFPLISFILVILFIVLALRNLTKVNNGKVAFIKALTAILIIILISRIIFQIYMFIYVNYVDPEWINNTAETWTQTMTESGLDAEKIDKNIERFRQYYEPQRMFTVEIVAMAIPQIILGLIASLFFIRFRKKPE